MFGDVIIAPFACISEGILDCDTLRDNSTMSVEEMMFTFFLSGSERNHKMN